MSRETSRMSRETSKDVHSDKGTSSVTACMLQMSWSMIDTDELYA